MSAPAAETAAAGACGVTYPMEASRRFSESMLWDLQREYFQQRGIAAWSEGEVPHYVTSNPTIANAYAEIVFSAWRDRRRLTGKCRAPFTVLELGAGPGRLGFHFLSRLLALCEQHDVSPKFFRYVLTDHAAANVEFWRRHPRFQSFIAAELLDLAVFDLEQDSTIHLQLSGTTLGPGRLQEPLVVIANYVFDSVPQELYYLDAGRYACCHVALSIDGDDPAALDVTARLRRVQLHYAHEPAEPAAQEPWLRSLLEGYARALDRTYLLFPAVALRCLDRLAKLSRAGLILLSADKGSHRLTDLQHAGAPRLTRHGSFSLNVNYHAIKMHCERRGGRALFPDRPHRHLNVGCCLLSTGADRYVETLRAFESHVAGFGPDDFFTVMDHARPHIAQMSVRDILAYLRLSRHDAHQFARYLPRLRQLAPTFNAAEHAAVCDAIVEVWDRYFPIGERLDLAGEIAALLYVLEEFEGALFYFRQSVELYGRSPAALENAASCLRMLGRDDEVEFPIEPPASSLGRR